MARSQLLNHLNFTRDKCILNTLLRQSIVFSTRIQESLSLYLHRMDLFSKTSTASVNKLMITKTLKGKNWSRLKDNRLGSSGEGLSEDGTL